MEFRRAIMLLILALICGGVRAQPAAKSPLEQMLQTELAEAAARADLSPDLGLTVNGSTQPESWVGWPLLVSLYVGTEQEEKLVLGARAGSWTSLLRLEVKNAGGQTMTLPFVLVGAAAPKVDVGRGPEQVTWVLAEEQATVLAPGDYAVSAILDSSKDGAPGYWLGRATSSPVTLRIAAAPATLTAEQEQQRDLLRVEVALRSGNANAALQTAEALAARRPDSDVALAARGDALVALGRGPEAAASYRRAAAAYARQHPDDLEGTAPLFALAQSALTTPGTSTPSATTTPPPGPGTSTPPATTTPPPGPGTSTPPATTTPPPGPGTSTPGATTPAATSGTTSGGGLLAIPLRGWVAATPAVRATHTTPPGWSERGENGVLLLTPPDLPAGAVVALVLPGVEAVGANYDAWFTERWKAVTEGFVVEAGGSIARRRTGAGLHALSTTARLKGADGSPIYIFFFTARAGTRAQRGAFITGTRELMDRHLAAATQFMETLVLAAP